VAVIQEQEHKDRCPSFLLLNTCTLQVASGEAGDAVSALAKEGAVLASARGSS
jgi:hypothetical protein